MKRALTSRTGARGFIVVAVLWMSGGAVCAGADLHDLCHQHCRCGGRQRRPDPDRSTGHRGRRTRRAPAHQPGRREASDERDLQRPDRCQQDIRDVPFRGCAHRPECGAEASARGADDGAWRESRTMRRATPIGSSPGVRPPSRARTTPKIRFIVPRELPTFRAMRRSRRRRNCGWCAEFRLRSSSACFPL